MSVTQVTIGLKKQTAGDAAWDVALNSGFDDAALRLTYSGTLDPNTLLTGFWKGQRYFQIPNIAFWVFNGTLGTNTGWVREIAQGVIMMWSGAIASIPQGWVLCDGVLHAPTGYTPPNLKSKFLVGYDPGDVDYNTPGKLGGTKTHVLTTAEMPAHTHPGSVTGTPTNIGSVGTASDGSSGNYRAGSATVVDSSSDLASHTHDVTVASQGGGAAHENRPPFYTIAYIAKL